MTYPLMAVPTAKATSRAEFDINGLTPVVSFELPTSPG